MKIAYLDGKRLYRVLYAGIQSLLDEQEYLNKINVFPVPDGDTGINMAFTLMGIVEHIQHHSRLALNELSQLVADAALDNARGNSGVIMAQFFQGLSQGLAPFSEVNTSQFAVATNSAVDEAYTALMNPIEGTILSVLRSWSDSFMEASKTSPDFQKVWKISLDAAQAALDRTPEQLKVLKDAGVVDAAGRGFLCILEGVMAFMDTGDIRQLPKIDSGFSSTSLEMENLSVSNLAFPFCTECIVVAEDISRIALSKALSPLGDSIVIAGSKHRAKIHIHTDDPGRLFEIARQYGQVQQEKVDDMREQNKSLRSQQEIALVVDSTCDLPSEIMEQHHIHVVPVRLNFGKEQYIDRVTITNEEFYAKLRGSSIHPQTSQPPPADFKRMYQFLSSHYKSILALHLPQVLSGTYQNSSAALEKVIFQGQQVILDTFSVSAGSGIIALEVVEAIEAGKAFEEVIEIAKHAIQNTQIFIALKTLDAVQRGGRLSLRKRRLIDLLHLNIVLSINKDGFLKPCGATFGRKQLFSKFEKFVLRKVKNRSIKRIGIMHGVNPETAEQLRKTFSSLFPEASILVADLCPALGVHGGVGAVGIALQYDSQ
ncbi:MAG: DegV family EDD domain-containing protein [Candidatus Marinimicrobia bacterium]|nr:DegV family EDD domain-containing protein [Candidatus Neomarinimicrobiota bacterium]